MESFSKEAEVIITSDGQNLSALKVLEWPQMGVTVKCPHTFVRIVCITKLNSYTNVQQTQKATMLQQATV